MIRLLPAILLLSGCATSDYEVRIFMDRGADVATGYMVENGVKHNFEIQLVQEDD